jgi:hypothetical protein
MRDSRQTKSKSSSSPRSTAPTLQDRLKNDDGKPLSPEEIGRMKTHEIVALAAHRGKKAIETKVIPGLKDFVKKVIKSQEGRK